MNRFFGWHWDFVGFGASFLCALHCMLLPIIFTTGIFTGGHWLTNPMIEEIFIGVSIAIACWSLVRSYSYKHQNIRPLLIAGLGFIALLVGQTISITNAHGLLAIGGGLIAYAHYYNWQLIHPPKKAVKKPRQRLILQRVVVIALLFIYFLGLRSAFEHNNTPPSREEVLELVWGIRH